VLRNKAAEICEKYLSKGDKVYVEGKLRTRKWQGEDGLDKYTTEVNVDEFTFLSTKKDNVSNTEEKPASENNNQKSDNTEDDLPF
jgi:single-strand DNA-binding protein